MQNLLTPPWIWDLNPIAFTVFGFGVRWYGLMYIINLLLAGWITYRLQQRHMQPMMNKKVFEDMLFGVFLWGIVGGRLGSFLFWEPHVFITDPLEVLQVWHGGMSIHGGVIGACVFLWFFGRRHGYKFLTLTDYIVPGLAVALILGRIANFINGELIGRITDGTWGVIFPHVDELPRHPSQLYEALKNVVLSLVLVPLAWRGKALQRTGLLSSIFLIGYGVLRFFIEFVREPESALFLGITTGQWLCLGMIIVAAGILFITRGFQRSATKQTGMTLIEIVVTIAVSAIVLTAAVSSFSSFLRTRTDIALQRHMQQEVVHMMHTITDSVRDYGLSDVSNNGFTAGSQVFSINEEGEFLLNEQPLLSPLYQLQEVSFVSPDGTHPRLEMSFIVTHRSVESVQIPIQHTISTRIYTF